MFIDASAIVAILTDEPEASSLTQHIERAGDCMTSPIAMFETVAALMRVKGCSRAEAESILIAFLAEADIGVPPITLQIGEQAIAAFERFGKGRKNRAQLNMGDCFAYACAREHRVPLLYKGDDFNHTDLKLRR